MKIKTEYGGEGGDTIGGEIGDFESYFTLHWFWIIGQLAIILIVLFLLNGIYSTFKEVI